MCVRVLRVSAMPFNTEIWVDDRPDCFTVYIDRDLVTERGADALEAALRLTASHWRRLDGSYVLRTLKAVAGGR